MDEKGLQGDEQMNEAIENVCVSKKEEVGLRSRRHTHASFARQAK
jgi:hypothetical protein